jgi:4-hydroxybenzoate polyprenyltransferase
MPEGRVGEERSGADAVMASGRVADAPPGNWVDDYAPTALRPYLRLARFDRPIGAWLLLVPCWWSQGLAEISIGASAPSLWLIALFLVGAFVMRGAGCVHNDIVDRKFDASVARTRSRPIPSGQVSVLQALASMALLLLIGLGVLVQLNRFTIILGASSLLLVAVYPFAKRYTYWPQIVLGLTFKWGALVGWSAVTGSLAASPLVLYAGSVLWTIGYDTIYAHQDREDDLSLGLKSTALRLGRSTPHWVAGFYIGAVTLWALSAWLAGAGLIVLGGLAIAAAMLAWQVATLDIDDAAGCLRRFKANRDVGLVLFAAIVLELLLR